MERFTGVARRHEDIDIAVFRADSSQLLRLLSADFHLWANSSGSLTPMHGGRVDVPSHASQIWARRSALSPWEVDFVIAEERDGNWVWRHDPTVTMTLADLTWMDDAGVRFARPEVVLAHKAKWRQPKDDLDFDAAWPLLDAAARAWLLADVEEDLSRPWNVKPVESKPPAAAELVRCLSNRAPSLVGLRSVTAAR